MHKTIWPICLLVLFTNTFEGQNNKPYTASYIMEWGNRDTIAIETFTMYQNHLYGKVVHGFPENHVRNFDITYNDAGSIENLIYVYNDIENTSMLLDSETRMLPIRFSAKLEHGLLDSRILEKPNPDHGLGNPDSYDDSSRIIHKTDGYHFNGDWIPIVSQFEWLVHWFLKQKKQKIQGLKFINAYIGIHDLQLERVEKSHIRFWTNISEAIEIYIDDAGRIESIDAIGSAWNLNIHRIDPVDIEHYLDSFKNRPTMGDPSPHETISQKIGGATMEIDYGRPSMRGRKIFGNIVPYSEIWRTGAGSATTISFNKDLNFGDQKVNAGKYNVYSLPMEDSFTLILNSKLDAWGSVHLSEFDVARLPMKLSQTDDTIEKFTIEIKDKGKKGVIRLFWENTIAEIEFVTK